MNFKNSIVDVFRVASSISSGSFLSFFLFRGLARDSHPVLPGRSQIYSVEQATASGGIAVLYTRRESIDSRARIWKHYIFPRRTSWPFSWALLSIKRALSWHGVSLFLCSRHDFHLRLLFVVPLFRRSDRAHPLFVSLSDLSRTTGNLVSISLTYWQRAVLDEQEENNEANATLYSRTRIDALL